jgi:adiponectin receptor
MTTILVLGVVVIMITLMDRFGTPEYRTLRALLFVCLGCFGFVPGIHTLVNYGWTGAVEGASLDRIFFMAFLYIFGAFLYGARIPERFLPGKCDIWFQSHQIFHLLVIAAAFVHYEGISQMAVHRLTKAGECTPHQSRSLT